MSTELVVPCKMAAVLSPKPDILTIVVSYDEGTQRETLDVCDAVCSNLSQHGFFVLRLVLGELFRLEQVWERRV